MSELTQIDIDEAFKEIKTEWDRNVEASGQTDAMFIALDTTGFASAFLHSYQVAKEVAESHGLVMPELVKGLEVTISESECSFESVQDAEVLSTKTIDQD